MRYAFERFQAEITNALLATGLIAPEELALQVPRAASVSADLALPCFEPARRRGLQPAVYAARLAEAARAHLPAAGFVGSLQAVGGFVNFALNAPGYTAAVLAEVEQADGAYGWGDEGLGRTVVVDYSSPNVAKRMHVGHIRSTIIGQALANLLRALEYRVVADNHLGDWGTQFGVLIAAIHRWGKPEGAGEALLEELESRYARYAGAAQHDPALAGAARSWSLRLEQGDPQARALWHEIVELTRQSNQRSYERLGVHFDTELGESFYAPLTGAVIDDALERGVAEHGEDGAVVVALDDLPAFLLRRSDGGTLYHTRDLAAVGFRVRSYQPARLIYVVDQRQELSFRQLFAAARALGYAPPEVALIHVPFGTVFGPNGQPLSTRRGNMVYLEALLDEAVARARAIVADKTLGRGADLTEEEQERIAEAVGVGAVIYNDLYQDTRRNLTLDWDRMLSLEGNSAAYLQYTHARCRSILRRAGGLPEQYDPALLVEPAEAAVVRALGQLPQAIRTAANSYAPNVLADWLYGTARQFAAFYRDCPVLDAPPARRAARLHLVAATAQALRNGLALLGVAAPERM
ncbi:MAG TPA: arginine--tRNA ligase [Thermomicrobiaceae bacterium]|nr:arginine--tRNA ligase [Thermomicrobiaceae bacterium]